MSTQPLDPSEPDSRDSDYLRAIESTLSEWCSAADEAAYQDLGASHAILDDQSSTMKNSDINARQSSGRMPRQPGSARGQIWMAKDFDAPLDDFTHHS